MRAKAPECMSYEGSNLPVSELARLNNEASEKHTSIRSKYELPGYQAQVENDFSTFENPSFVAETSMAPAGSFQRYTEFVCHPDDIDPTVEKAMRDKLASFDDQIAAFKKDARYKGIDLDGFAKEARAVNNEYPVLNVVPVLQFCGVARSEGQTVAEYFQTFGSKVDITAHTMVLGAEILCPDIAGELPPLPVDCGEVSLSNSGDPGAVEVRVGDVDCDEAKEVIVDSWKQLNSEGAKGISYEVNGVTEYVCNIAGAAESDSEHYDYKCDSPMGDKVITWTEQ